MKLDESLEKIYRLYDPLPIGFFAIDESGNVRDANEAGLALLGVTREDILSSPFTRHVASDYQTIFISHKELLLSTKLPQSCELKLTRKDGSEVFTHCKGNVVENHEARQIELFLVDLTEQTKTKEALYQCDEKLRLIVYNSPDQIFQQDKDLRYVWVPRINIPGISMDNLGKTDFELYPKEAERLAELKRKVMETGVGVKTELSLTCRDEVRYYDATYEQWKDREGNVRGIIGYVRDITERWRAEEFLRQSEENFKRLFDQSPIGSAITSLDNRFVRVNETLCRITGYSANELTSMKFPDITHPDDRAVDVGRAKQLVAGEIDQYSREKRYIRKDGNIIWVNLFVRIVKDAAGRPLHFLATMEDITARKHAEEEVRHRLEFEKLISSLSTKFITLPINQVDDGIDEALRKIGEYASVDLSAIFLCSKDGSSFSNVFEWNAGGVESQRQKLQDVPFSAYPWFANKITKGEIVCVNRITDLPPEARAEKEIFETLQYKSLINIPMMYENKIIGFVGLDNIRAEKSWSADTISLLKIVGEMFTNALERKWADKALRESELKYKSIFDNSSVGIMRSAREGRFLSVNPAFVRMMGYASAEEMMHSITDISRQLYACEGEREKFLMKIADSGGKVVAYETYFRRKDGSVLPVSLSGWVVYDQKGNADHFEGLIEDISDRKRTEEALRQSEQKYRGLFETMAQGVTYQDADGKIVLANPAAEKILGLSHDQLLGRTSMDPRWRTINEDGSVLSGENHPSMIALRTGKEVRNVLMGVFNPATEEYRWIIVNAVPQFRPGEERPFQVFSTFEDVTGRKKAQELLQTSETRYRELFKNMSSGVAVYRGNEDGTDFSIVDFNHAGERIEKVKKEEIINKSIFEVFPGVKEFGLFSVLHRVWETGKPEQFPVSFYKDNRISGWRENYVYKLPSGEVVAVYDDVTERKRAEEALRESEKRYRSIFENAVVGMFTTSLDGKIIAVNPAIARMTGYASPEEMKNLVTDLARQVYLHPEDRAKFIEMIQKSEGRPVTFEAWFRRKDGSSYLGRLDAWLVRDREGKVIHLEGFVEDITERRKAEETLRENEARFRAVIQTSSDGIVIFGQTGKVLFVNEAEAKINGYPSPEDMVRDLSYFAEVYELCYPDGRLLPVNEWPVSKVLRGESVREWELKGRRKDTGQEWFFSFNGEPVFDSQSRLILAVVFTRDITARKKAEDALRESENRYRAIFENTGTATIILEDDMTIALVNSEFERLSGLAREEIEHKKKWGEFVARDDLGMTTEFHRRRRINATDIPEKYELKFVDRAGNVRKVIITADMIPDTKRSVLSLQDITTLKQTEEQLTKAREVAEKRAHEAEEGKRIMEALMEQIPEGIIVVDAPEGNVITISKYGEEMVGSMAEGLEAEKYPNWQLLHTDGITPASNDEYPLVRAARYGQIVTNEEWIMRKIDGKNIAVLINAGPIKDVEGKLIGGVATWRDVTERKQEQEKLKYSYEKLQRSIDGIISAIVKIVETRDPYTAGHEKRVSQLATAIAREMGLSEEKVSGIRMAAVIHDIGKIYVPAEILSKPGNLSDMEFAIIKIHPQASYDILKVIEFPWPIAQIALQHQERLNGSGYPLGLKDGDILLEARILSVADVVEAMGFSRPYRSAVGIDKALEEISNNKGILYDPDAVDAALKLFREKGFKFEES